MIGQSGTGKSYYTGALLEQTVPAFDLAVHYDIEDEERGLSDVHYDPIYQSLFVEAERARKLDWIQVIGNHRKLRVIPEEMTVEEMQELYAVICQCVLHICKHLATKLTGFVSCDEAHNLVPQHAFDRRVERLLTGGRKHGVECLHISQRPQLLHTTVISQADRRIYFRVNDDNDLSKINKMSGFNALNELPKLEDRTCIIENKSTGDWTVLDTNTVTRQRPHYSQDDGIVDEHLPI